MKKSNKVLLGGFLFPILVTLIFIGFMSVNSTKDKAYQLGNEYNHLGSYNYSF